MLVDTAGEYTHIMDPTDNPRMIEALKRRGVKPHGLTVVGICHLVGRETRNPNYHDNCEFPLQLSAISRYVASEILGLNEPQDDRFQKAYDLTGRMLMDLQIYPSNNSERAELLKLDEMEEGFPRMTLPHLYDVTRFCSDHVAKADVEQTPLRTPEFRANRDRLKKLCDAEKLPGVVSSWHKVSSGSRERSWGCASLRMKRARGAAQSWRWAAKCCWFRNSRCTRTL